MTNAYCDLAALKSAGALNINGSAYDRRLLSLLEEASRQIDNYCNRHFYVRHATRQFEANWWSAGLQQLLVPDLVGVDAVRVAPRFDGPAREPKWRTASFRLYPLDAAPQQPWGRPYTRLAIEPVCGFNRRQPDCHALVEVAGRWGYREVTSGTGATVAGGGMAAGARAFQVSPDAPIAAGHTLSIAGDTAEQVYVIGIDGQQVTVERGVNGTQASLHAAGVAINLYHYPGPVVEACLQLATRHWYSRQREAVVTPGTASQVGSRHGESAGLGRELGREVEALLSAYRKLAV